MAKVFELLEQIMSETCEELGKATAPPGTPPQMVLAKEATVAGFEKMLADLQRLRELANSPRITSWVESRRGGTCRDAGATSTIVELLDLLRSMA